MIAIKDTVSTNHHLKQLKQWNSYRFRYRRHIFFLHSNLRHDKPPGVRYPFPGKEAAPEPRSIVGKSRTVYLEEPPKAKPPAFSEELKKEKPYGEEPDITGNDVDDSLDNEIPPEEERFIPLDTDEAVSTGMACGQISGALDAVQGRKRTKPPGASPSASCMKLATCSISWQHRRSANKASDNFFRLVLLLLPSQR
jgi:hypothetical protein